MRNEAKQDPPAPVVGGCRWRRPFHDIADMCRQAGGFVLGEPARPRPPAAPVPEAVIAPLITSTPPPEARVGEQYVYHARAHAADMTGFTWYFEKSVPGMTVDRHTGKVAWTPSAGGWTEVALCARSVYGAMSRQDWTICVRKAAAIGKAAPNPRYAAAVLRKRLLGARPIGRVWRAERRRSGFSGRATGPPGGRPRVALPLRE